jgi:RimJ/RimL family protein N-acetyltransferase
MKLFVGYGFDSLNFHSITLHVYETNPRAKRSYEKAGFTVDGRLREARYLEGKYEDVFIMSILKNEWNSEEKKGDSQ